MSDTQAKQIVIPYQPRPWQITLHSQMKRNNVLAVHRGAGKSVLAINEMIRRIMTGPIRVDYLYLLPFKNQAQRNVWDPLKYYLSTIPGMKHDNVRLESRFPNGSRLMILGTDEPDRLRGLHVAGIVLDEFADMTPGIWPVIAPMTTNHSAWLIFIGTPKGKVNQFYDKFMEAGLPENEADWFRCTLPYTETGALPEDEVEKLRRSMSSDMFAQEMLVDWTASNAGAYYAKQVTELRSNGNIVYDDWPADPGLIVPPSSLFRPDLEVHVGMDIGIRDYTSLWWFQIVRNGGDDVLHFIDFAESANMGLPEWNDVICNKERDMGYRRGSVIFPHDVKVREWGAGVSRIEHAERLGIWPEICPDHRVEDRIETVRRWLPECRFDGRRCAEGLEALAQYREKTDKMGRGMGVPLKDGSDHACDSIGYCILYAKQVMSQPALMRVPMARHR